MTDDETGAPSGAGASPTEPAEATELARLQAEKDVLAQRVVKLEDRAGRRLRLRKFVAAVLVVVVSITFTASVVAVWARRNFLNNTVFSERVGPLIAEPEVKAVVSQKLGDEITKLIDARAVLAQFLPERAQVLAVPLANAVNGFIRDQVRDYVNSPEFDKLWMAVTSRAHKSAVAVLRGENTAAVSTQDGKVTLNLVPIIDEVLARIGQLSPEIFGRKINLPTVTVEDAPKAAITKIESAFGVDLGDGYGQITVLDSDKLSEAQDAIALFDKLTILIVIVTLVLLPLAVWVSPRRRRTVLQLVVGLALGMVLIRRFSYRLEDDLLALVRIDENRAAVETVLAVFVEPLRMACAWILAGLGTVAAAALVSGPYPWAQRLRAGVAHGARGAGDIMMRGAAGARDPRVAMWLRAHRDLLRVGEVIVAFFALLVFDLSWLGLLLIALAIGGLEFFFARSGSSSEPPEGPPPPIEPAPA